SCRSFMAQDPPVNGMNAVNAARLFAERPPFFTRPGGAGDFKRAEGGRQGLCRRRRKKAESSDRRPSAARMTYFFGPAAFPKRGGSTTPQPDWPCRSAKP